MIRILHITQFSSRNAGGLFNSVRQLAQQTASALAGSAEVHIISFKDNLFEADRGAWHPLTPIGYQSLVSNPYGMSWLMLRDVISQKYDIVHLHGIWSFVSWVAAASVWRGATLIVSPRGMLDPWILNRSRLKKKIVGALVERRLLNSARRIHSLSESESRSVHNYVGGQKVVQIPNAVDDIAASADFTRWRSEFVAERTRPKVLLFLGRLHEKKGLENLVAAIRLLRSEGIGPDRLIVNVFGWGDPSYVSELSRKIEDSGLGDQVLLKGAVVADEKVRALAQSDAFILPSSSEGLPMAALEAASSSLPMLLTNECNLPEFFGSGAIRIERNPGSISLGITQVLLSAGSAQLAEQAGALGRERFLHDFSWAAVMPRYLELYSQ